MTWNTKRMGTSLVILVALSVALVAGCADSDPRETKVGRAHRAFVDADRLDWDGKAPRPLATTIWYAAAPGSAETEWRAGPFRFGRNALDAGFRDDVRRPLLLLSHGTGGSGAQLSWLAEALVDAGFVVAAVNHHGNTAAEPGYRAPGFVLPGERVRDLATVIDRLASDPVLGPRIDPARIGAAGFSLGGYTVLAATGALALDFAGWRARCAPRPQHPGCRLPPEADFTLAEVEALLAEDAQFRVAMERGRAAVEVPAIRAVYAMAPALVSLADARGALEVPVRVVLAQHDAQVPHDETEAFLRGLSAQVEVRTLPDAGHYAFLSPCTLRGRWVVAALCRDAGGLDRRAVHREIARDAAAFFTQHLAGGVVEPALPRD